MKRRRIAVVTTSRADYSHLYWPLRMMTADECLEVDLIVMGPHLSPEFGMTVDQIEGDGFRIGCKVECLLSSDSDVGMAKTIGLAMLSLADHLGHTRPDLLLVTADRYEMLAPTAVALSLRVPIAHIEGGEVSEGAIDDAVRNALTKMSHIHFTSTERARQRVIAMGEDPNYVFRAGAPSLDHTLASPLKSGPELRSELGLPPAAPFALVTFHPTTILHETTAEADEVFAALEQIDNELVFCYPNADAGSRHLLERAEHLLRHRGSGRLFANLDPVTYWSLLREAYYLIGNSSSGVMEAASFGVPAIDIGIRQQGRERGCNVISVPAERAAILAGVKRAIDADFRAAVAGMGNPYGDGHAADRIATVLRMIPLGEAILRKPNRL